MGAEVCRAVLADPDCELVAAVDPRIELAALPAGVADGHDAGGPGRRPGPRSRSTSPSPRRRVANAAWCADHGVHAVIGTSGLDRGRSRRPACRVRRRAGPLPRRPQLRHRRGADDPPGRAGRALLRDRRDHRAAPRRQGRRAVGDGDAHRRTARRGVGGLGARPDHDRQPPRRARRAGRGRHPDPLGPHAGDGRPPGGAARHDGPDAVDPPRLLRPHVVHARGAAGGEAHRGPAGPHRGLDAFLEL